MCMLALMPENPALTRSRTPITARLRPAAIQKLDELAHHHSKPGLRVNRTDVIRAALVVAARHGDEYDKAITEIRDQG